MKINLALIGAFFLASMGCAALAQSSAYKGPIIDVHVHVENGQAQDFIQTMDKEKVEFAVSMAFPADRVKLTSSNKKLLSLCDAEFIRPLANGDNATALAWAKRHIGKDCIGFGEVGVRHYNKTAKRDGGKDQPTYVAPFQSDAMDVFLSHANNQAKPVVFHIEPFYDVKKINSLTEVKRFYVEICQKFPKIKIIAAHNGMMPASDLEDLFKKCFNLFSDFKFLTSRNSFAGFRDLHTFHKTPRKMREEKDPIKSDWRALIQKYEDRFLFGSDVKPMQKHNDRRSDYSLHIAEVRGLVAAFEPRIQQKIMYSNAKAVFNLAK